MALRRLWTLLASRKASIWGVGSQTGGGGGILPIAMTTPSPEPEEITLVFRFEDFADPEDERDDLEGDEPCDSPVMVVSLGSDRYEVYEPTSLTPLGPLALLLSAGTRIRVKKMDGGYYRLVEILERLPVWTWLFPADQRHTLESDVKATLDALSENDCRWEWSAGNFTIQKLKSPDQDAPDPSLVEKIDALRKRVAHSKPE